MKQEMNEKQLRMEQLVEQTFGLANETNKTELIRLFSTCNGNGDYHLPTLSKSINRNKSLFRLIPVADFDQAARMILDMGGVPFSPVLQVFMLGRIGYFRDAVGNCFGIVQPNA